MCARSTGGTDLREEPPDHFEGLPGLAVGADGNGGAVRHEDGATSGLSGMTREEVADGARRRRVSRFSHRAVRGVDNPWDCPTPAVRGADRGWPAWSSWPQGEAWPEEPGWPLQRGEGGTRRRRARGRRRCLSRTAAGRGASSPPGHRHPTRCHGTRRGGQERASKGGSARLPVATSRQRWSSGRRWSVGPERGRRPRVSDRVRAATLCLLTHAGPAGGDGCDRRPGRAQLPGVKVVV